MDMFHTISCSVTDMSQPWMEYDWNEKTQEYEVQRVIHFDTDYDLASFTLLPDGVTAEELIASSPHLAEGGGSHPGQRSQRAGAGGEPSGAVADFASGRAQITQGRSISQEVPRRRGGVPDLRVSVPGKRPERGGYPAAVAV